MGLTCNVCIFRKLAASWTLKQFQPVLQNSRQLFLTRSKCFFKWWEEKRVLQVVVYTCSTMSPILPSTVGPPGSFLHWEEDTHHPSSLCAEMVHLAAGSFWEKLSAALFGMADSGTTVEIPKHWCHYLGYWSQITVILKKKAGNCIHIFLGLVFGSFPSQFSNCWKALIPTAVKMLGFFSFLFNKAFKWCNSSHEHSDYDMPLYSGKHLPLTKTQWLQLQ